jgi:hypothetical protein
LFYKKNFMEGKIKGIGGQGRRRKQQLDELKKI